jgi:hypothetical protein
MKRTLLSLIILGFVAFAVVSSEAQACGGRFRSRARTVVTAPVRLFKAVRVRRCQCGPECPCGTSCPAR